MPDVDPHDIEKAIKAIQNIAIMLTGASEAVCEGRILKRFSKEIETNLERLEADIASLKKKFPGKFPESLKPDSSLSKIRDIAIVLGGGNSDVEAECRKGNLGNELTTGVFELKGIVKDIWNALGGKVSAYTFADRMADYGRKVKSSLLDLSPLVSNTGRIFLAVIVVAIFSFVYLFLTMESEDTLLKSIKDDRASIEKQKDTLETQKREYKEISEKIKSLDKKKIGREDKIQLLDLSMKERKIKDLIDKTTFSMETREKDIAEKRKKIEEIRKKSFLQKLLRR
ncbi:MAG: hypothetical protein HWN70_08945 [Desulfobacterales bacterium]|nr:hypothetical protein [Desulfobacterales bacterium]